MGESESGAKRTASAPPGVARLTPYELVFGGMAIENDLFPRLGREAEERGEDPARRERFGFLSVGADLLRELIPPETPPDALEQYRALLFQSFNFWRFGRRTYVVHPAVARYLVESRPTLQDWDLVLPHPSVYVQLPANLFWASIATDVPPEPVDGFFVTESRGIDPLGPSFRQLDVLMVLGIHHTRAGFSVIPFETEVGQGIPRVWADGPPREDGGRDFASVLPGGEMAGLYSVVTTEEALNLLARLLWYVDGHPEDVALCGAPERRTQERPGNVSLSRLPYHRVGFGVAGAAPPDCEPAGEEPAPG